MLFVPPITKGVFILRLPNGYGSVTKLKGKRRNPWRVRRTVKIEIGDDGKIKQKMVTIGYYATRAEAMEALANYNQDPYDLKSKRLTFSEVYELWSEEHFKTIVPSAQRTWKSAYVHSAALHDIRFDEIRAAHLEAAIRNEDVGGSTKGRMKSLYNQMFRYALKHDICNKDYAALCEVNIDKRAKIERVIFTNKEIETLFENRHVPFVDMVLVGIYSGWRPQELAVLRTENIDLDAGTMHGGLKTDAGRNRTIPIHPKIYDIVADHVAEGGETLFIDPKSQTGPNMTYEKYYQRFLKIMDTLEMKHKPHDTRHTFSTLAKKAKMNEYIQKRIMGHKISDVTEAIYTHWSIEDLRNEIMKIK